MGSFRETAMQSAEEMRAHLTAKASEDIDFRKQLVAELAS